MKIPVFLPLCAHLLAGSLMAAETDVLNVFAKDADEIVIERLPLDWEPGLSNLFDVSPQEMEQLERPAQLRQFLASFTGLRTYQLPLDPDVGAAPLSSAPVQVESGRLTVRLSGSDLFPAEGEPVLTDNGRKSMTAVCQQMAPYLGKPMILDLWFTSAQRAQTAADNLLSYLAETLWIEPDEIETAHQVNPGEREEVIIQILGVTP